MISETEIRDQIVEVGRWLYEKRFITATEGNISVEFDGRLFFTPSGACKGILQAREIVETDLNGFRIAGHGDPSSEAVMHVEIYRRRPDVHAVVHAHPPYATAHSVAGIALTKAVLPEVILMVGSVPLAEYATPGTREMASAVGDSISQHDAVLLANHGAVTCGFDLRAAYFRMETLEHFAWISTIARILGGERELTPDQLANLRLLPRSHE
jgi:L-fuculose-phosphate aldolase